jgi:hypothetical protein
MMCSPGAMGTLTMPSALIHLLGCIYKSTKAINNLRWRLKLAVYQKGFVVADADVLNKLKYLLGNGLISADDAHYKELFSSKLFFAGEFVLLTSDFCVINGVLCLINSIVVFIVIVDINATV